MRFENRETAARLLAGRLKEYRGQHPLILAIPRGAVPMGRILADAIGGELDVVLVRKLGAPGNPELAVGSVAEDGEIVVNDWVADYGIPRSYIDGEARNQLAVIRERRRRYTPDRRPIDPAGRVVIVLDDGVATGATLLSALHLARAKGPRKLVAAVAVAPPETLEKLARAADEVVCLATPDPFFAVGLHFIDFSEVSDAEVVAALKDRPSVPAAVS